MLTKGGALGIIGYVVEKLDENLGTTFTQDWILMNYLYCQNVKYSYISIVTNKSSSKVKSAITLWSSKMAVFFKVVVTMFIVTFAYASTTIFFNLAIFPTSLFAL